MNIYSLRFLKNIVANLNFYIEDFENIEQQKKVITKPAYVNTKFKS